MARYSGFSYWLLVMLAQVQLAVAVRWVTAWTDLGLGGSALLSWADMGQSDALLELKSTYKDTTTVLVKREVPPGIQHPYLFKLPNEDAVGSGELQYDARYWFQVTSVDTGDSDKSPDYYLSRENVLKRRLRPDGDDGDDNDNGSASSAGDTSGAIPSSTAISSATDSTSSSEPTATGDSSNNGQDGVSRDDGNNNADNGTQTGVAPARESGETQGSDQGTARTNGSGPTSTGSISENGKGIGREDEGDGGDNGDNSSLDNKTRIIIGVSVGLGGGSLLLLGLFCFVKRRKQRRRKRAQAAIVERDTVPELDNVEAKAKQELEGGQRHEKSNDHQIYEKDGGQPVSELPGAPVVDRDLHTDGRNGGRSEMAG